MSGERTCNGICFCGAVQFTASGESAAMGYRHCESCSRWSAGPVYASEALRCALHKRQTR